MKARTAVSGLAATVCTVVLMSCPKVLGRIVYADNDLLFGGDGGSCPGDPDWRLAVPCGLDGIPPVDLRDFVCLAADWGTENISFPEEPNEPNMAYCSAVLKEQVDQVPNTASGRFVFLGSSTWSPPWPYAFADNRLVTPEAVPYLIQVLREGPEWTDDELRSGSEKSTRYFARCYAALCLGLSKDPRAFDPLLDVLLDTRIAPFISPHPVRKNRYDLRDFAAFALGDLGDCRAIEPLLAALRNDHFPLSIYSLLKLDAFSTVPSIIEVAVEHNLLSTTVHSSLMYALKVHFTLTHSHEDETWTVEEFPGLVGNSVSEICAKLWLHWLDAGDQYAREWFDAYYSEWDTAVREQPDNRSYQNALLNKMLTGGMAVIPYIIDKMKQGDERLVEALTRLIRCWRVEGCTAAQWLQWWTDNRQQWQVFDTTCVTMILRVPAGYATIQAAIDASVDGDMVLVAPGTYTGDGNRDIDFRGKAITVRSETGPEFCIIQCGGRYPQGDGTPTRSSPIQLIGAEYHRGFYFHSDEDANSVVQGFTVTEGYLETEDGGAFYCVDSSPTIRDCVITSNVARQGAGIAACRSEIRVEDCIVVGNIASFTPWDWFYGGAGQRGGGMALYDGHSQVVNCLVVGNVATSQGGGIYCSGSHQFVNCTVAGNRTGRGGIGGGISCGPGGNNNTAHLCSSVVWGNIADRNGNDIDLLGEPVLFAMRLRVLNTLLGDEPDDVYDPFAHISGQWLVGNPLFMSDGYWDPNGTPDKPGDDFWVDGDYHLKSQAGRWDPNSQNWVQDDVTSPCIDAGDPNDPIGDEPFPNGGRINMGDYGGTAEASKSYFGEPVSETVIAGDINGDGKVDWRDLEILSRHWLQGYRE
jgi:predicted outer membrane repeat protein